MRLIAHLSEQINEEVDGVLGYAKDAVEYKKLRPTLAEVYYKIAHQEFQHVTALHDQVMAVIKEAENSGVEYPQFMRNKWDDQHKAIVEKMAEAKVYLSLYR